MKKTQMRRAAAAAGIVSVAAVTLASLGAGNAVAGKLPGGFVTQTLVDGTKVTVQLKNEFFALQRSTVALPTSRNVVVSGQIIVSIGGGAKGGTISAGYDVGCQVNFGGSNLCGTAGIDGLPQAATPSLGASSNFFNIGPGKVTYVPIIQNTDSTYDTTNDNYNITSNSFKGARGGVAFSQEQFSIDGCAGFAQARANITVNVSTDSVDGYVTLHGRQFSLG